MLHPEDMHRTLSAAYQELRAAARVAKQRRAEIDLLPEPQRNAALDEYIAILKELEATAQALLDCIPEAAHEQRRNGGR
jgi:hypothetical protein